MAPWDAVPEKLKKSVGGDKPRREPSEGPRVESICVAQRPNGLKIGLRSCRELEPHKAEETEAKKKAVSA
jgi:hypothetical protein